MDHVFVIGCDLITHSHFCFLSQKEHSQALFFRLQNLQYPIKMHHSCSYCCWYLLIAVCRFETYIGCIWWDNSLLYLTEHRSFINIWLQNFQLQAFSSCHCDCWLHFCHFFFFNACSFVYCSAWLQTIHSETLRKESNACTGIRVLNKEET